MKIFERVNRPLLFSIAAVAIAASCQKPQDNLLEPDPLDDGTPVKVLLGTNVINATAKASGPLDKFNSTTLSIFAIDKASTNWTQGDPFLLKNYSVTTEANLTSTSTPTSIETDKYYKDNVNYKFFGYYVDDLLHTDDKLTVSAHAVTLPVEITGYEDILLATTDEAEDYKAAQQTAQNNNQTFNTNRVYSAYSARRGVVPNLVFNHKLTRLDFVFKTGEAIDENTKVEVVGIAVGSVKNGLLTVAGDGQGLVPANENEVDLPLKYPTESAALVMPSAKDDTANFGDNGNSIMVYPKSDSYKLAIKIRQSKKVGEKWTSGPVEERTFAIALSGAAAFEAGKKYEVTVITYGMEPVIVGVKLSDWAVGENVTIDSDK